MKLLFLALALSSALTRGVAVGAETGRNNIDPALLYRQEQGRFI